MLQENSRFLPEAYEAPLLYAEHVEDVAVVRLHRVALVGKAVRLDDLLEGLEVVGHEDGYLVVHRRVTVAGSSRLRLVSWLFHLAIVPTEYSLGDTPHGPHLGCQGLYARFHLRLVAHEVFARDIPKVGVAAPLLVKFSLR